MNICSYMKNPVPGKKKGPGDFAEHAISDENKQASELEEKCPTSQDVIGDSQRKTYEHVTQIRRAQYIAERKTNAERKTFALH